MTNEQGTATTTEQPKAILLRKHHDLSSFCSSDPVRYVINGVHYDAKLKVLEGCNGRILLRVPVVESDEFPPIKGQLAEQPVDCIIPLPALKKALGNIPKTKHMPFLEHVRLDANGKVTLSTTDTDQEQSVTVKPIEGNYPNTSQVIPTAEPTFSVCIAGDLLKTIGEYSTKHCAEKAGVTFHFTDENSAIRFDLMLEDHTKATGILMPMKLA